MNRETKLNAYIPQVDSLARFWSEGISNSLTVIEHKSYLIFQKLFKERRFKKRENEKKLENLLGSLMQRFLGS
jgi:hypothetical protein